jgi:hypothetical protein
MRDSVFALVCQARTLKGARLTNSGLPHTAAIRNNTNIITPILFSPPPPSSFLFPLRPLCLCGSFPIVLPFFELYGTV